jgi:glutamate synthase (NADPH/NADH) small chain
MTKLPEDRTEVHFGDYKGAYTQNQALVEANRCLYCEDAPCTQICPTHIDIPEFIRKIATTNVEGSARTIFESNILGMSCARVCPVEVLCVGDCVFNDMGVPPIQIGKLQRYATDMAYENGWSYFEAGPDSGKSVGLVGAGPASLACAHELRRFGHAVTIYEKSDHLGGLNTDGVAPYKIKADVSVAEAEWVLSIGGVDLRTGIEIGVTQSWTSLEDQHDAVFVGAGLGADKYLKTPGEELAGVQGAVEWIERMKLGRVDLADVNTACVIGGGNTAMDCVRELLGLGVANVYLVYRGDEEGMSGYDHEWAWAKREGARAEWRSMPRGYEAEDGVVKRVRCERLDAQKQPTGEEFVIETDFVLLAVGQAKLGDIIADQVEGVESEWGRLVVDENGALGRKGWYAGGDAANGAKEVVNAAAEGKLAAQSIHRYLGGS